jgi:hypothetical protein
MTDKKNDTLDDMLKPEDVKSTEVKQEVKPVQEDSGKDEVIEKLLKRIERLEKTSNKKRLDQYDRLNQDNPETIYKLRTIDGKVIIRWSDLHLNKAEVDPVTRRIIEDQPLTVYYEDGTEEEMQLVVFNRRYEYIFTTLVEEKILRKPEEIAKNGNRIFTVETDEGKKYEIGELFIN